MRERPANPLYREGGGTGGTRAPRRVAPSATWGGPLTFQGKTAAEGEPAQAGIPTAEEYVAAGWTPGYAQRLVEQQRVARGSLGTLYSEAFRRPFGERGGRRAQERGRVREGRDPAGVADGDPTRQAAMLQDRKAFAIIQQYRLSKMPSTGALPDPRTNPYQR